MNLFCIHMVSQKSVAGGKKVLTSLQSKNQVCTIELAIWILHYPYGCTPWYFHQTCTKIECEIK